MSTLTPKIYKILTSYKMSALERDVNKHLREGYELVGGVSASISVQGSSHTLYAQAVILNETESLQH